MKYRLLASAAATIAMAIALVAGVSAGAQNESPPDIFGEFEDALKTESGEALIEFLGGLRPVDEPDPERDTQSFDGQPVADAAVRNDVIARSDAIVSLPSDVVDGLVGSCGTENTNGYFVACPEYDLDTGALTNVRVMAVQFGAPLVTDSTIHVVAAGNADARPDVPARPDQPLNLLSGWDQFLRIEIAPGGTPTYGYFLFTDQRFQPFRVNTLALTGEQYTFFIAAAPELDWNTYGVFTDAETVTGVPIGDGTDARAFSEASGTLTFAALPDDPAGDAQPGPAPVGGDEPAPIAQDEPAPIAQDEPAPIAQDEPAPIAQDEPAPVALDEPTVQTASDGDGGGAPVWPIVFVTAGAGTLIGGTVMLRRNRGGDSVLTFSETPVAAPKDDTAARNMFETAMYREADIQARLQGSYELFATRIATGLADYRAATSQYAQGFNAVRRDAQFLAGVAQEWEEGRQYTEKLDLALGVLEGGRALYDLGKAGWARLGPVLFKQADEAAGTAVSAGRALVDSTPELRSIAGEAAGINIAGHLQNVGKYARGADEILVEAADLAIEGGVDFATYAPARIAELRTVFIPLHEAIGVVWLESAQAAAKSRGWVKAADDTSSLLGEVLVTVKAHCNGGAASPENVRQALTGFHQLVNSQPEFWETVPKLYGVLGDARQADCSINLLYDVNQLDFLRFVDDQLDAGADLAGLQAAWQAKVGPIGAAGQRIAVTSAGEFAGQALLGGAKVENAYDFLAGTGTGAPVIRSIFPTLDAYMAQNQILNPTLFGYEAGESLPLTMTFNAVNAVGGLSTWMLNFTASMEGGLLWTTTNDELQPTFTAMGGSALDVLAAVDRLNDAVSLTDIGIADRIALRDTLATMDAAVTAASPELRAELQPQLDDRRAHVTQKLAQLDQVAGTLADARNWMGTLRDTLAGQVRTGRTTLQWADPGLAWTFVGTGVVLDGFAYGVLNTASVTPPPDANAPPSSPGPVDTNKPKND